MLHVRLCYSDLPVELVASIAAFAKRKRKRKILSDKESFIVYKNFYQINNYGFGFAHNKTWSWSVIITSKSTFDAVDVIDTHVTSQIHMPKPSHRATV